jgi:hypothetical protein
VSILRLLLSHSQDDLLVVIGGPKRPSVLAEAE